MLPRLILGLIVSWLVLIVIRAAIQAATPRNTHYRRGAPPLGVQAQRREALAILGLYEGAKPAEIKKAYRELAGKYHPDRVAHLGPELVDLTSEKLKQINAAHDFLSGK
jgi:DnaJ-domain-containing protein 1